jgi:hypothetical protein
MKTDKRPALVRRGVILLTTIGLVAAGLFLLTQNLPAADPELRARQTQIADKGREVMPFDLERTTHRFAKAGSGGVQTVFADVPTDDQQIALIRRHVAKEAEAFSRGDFGDPASIHGSAMPGLSELEGGYRSIDVRYAQTPAGAQITYTTTDNALVRALHAWFDAQVSDHGNHAEGHSG